LSNLSVGSRSAGVVGLLIFEADIHSLFAEQASTYAPLLRLP
jgi:hypothetical protein